MSQYCISCGAQNQDNAKFCRSCGGAFGESKRSVESAPIENSIKYESKFTQIKSSFAEFYFSTQGRVSRQEFFFRGFMPLALLTVFFLFISNVLMAAESQSVQNMNYLVILLAITAGVSQVMISIKRFHDFNASGSWSILLFIPLANIIVQMVLLFKGSVNSENEYGDEIGFYEQTPMRWVLFVVQFILIFVLIVFNGFAKYINENKQLQGGKETQSSVAPQIQQKNNSTHSEVREIGYLYPLDTITVNLKSDAGRRYLKVTMSLELEGKKLSIELDKKIPVIRDRIIRIFTSKTLEEISTRQGKEEISNQIINTLNAMLTSGNINGLYFTEFVIQ